MSDDLTDELTAAVQAAIRAVLETHGRLAGDWVCVISDIGWTDDDRAYYSLAGEGVPFHAQLGLVRTLEMNIMEGDDE